MDLILWRHAEAEDGSPDLARELTPLGRAQAARMSAWMHAHLPAGFRLLASPAVRAQQTAQALATPVKTVAALAPGAAVSTILAAAGWPEGTGAAVVVGHQPDLGRTAAFLVSGGDAEWRIDKGALWWIAGRRPAFVRAVMSPAILSREAQ
jgi:phosphohistidine phosphatase